MQKITIQICGIFQDDYGSLILRTRPTARQSSALTDQLVIPLSLFLIQAKNLRTKRPPRRRRCLDISKMGSSAVRRGQKEEDREEKGILSGIGLSGQQTAERIARGAQIYIAETAASRLMFKVWT